MKLVELMYNYLFIIYVLIFLTNTDNQVQEAVLEQLLLNSPQRYIKGEFRADIDLSDLKTQLKIMAELRQ
jgi:hypothetical protein